MKKQTELVVKNLIREKKYTFNLQPQKSILKNIAQKLDLLSLSKLSFMGQINCIKSVDLKLEATLSAIVTQKCVTTLVPVQSKIASKVQRLFIKGWADSLPSSSETTLETIKEVLTDKINLMTIIIEELSLEIPVYPRSKNTDSFFLTPLKQSNETSDKTISKPFAILSDLKEKME